MRFLSSVVIVSATLALQGCKTEKKDVSTSTKEVEQPPKPEPKVLTIKPEPIKVESKKGDEPVIVVESKKGEEPVMVVESKKGVEPVIVVVVPSRETSIKEDTPAIDDVTVPVVHVAEDIVIDEPVVDTIPADMTETTSVEDIVMPIEEEDYEFVDSATPSDVPTMIFYEVADDQETRTFADAVKFGAGPKLEEVVRRTDGWVDVGRTGRKGPNGRKGRKGKKTMSKDLSMPTAPIAVATVDAEERLVLRNGKFAVLATVADVVQAAIDAEIAVQEEQRVAAANPRAIFKGNKFGALAYSSSDDEEEESDDEEADYGAVPMPAFDRGFHGYNSVFEAPMDSMDDIEVPKLDIGARFAASLEAYVNRERFFEPLTNENAGVEIAQVEKVQEERVVKKEQQKHQQKFVARHSNQQFKNQQPTKNYRQASRVGNARR